MPEELVNTDRFTWLGKGVAPDGVEIPEDNPSPVLRDVLPPSQVVGSDEGLSIFRWLMADEEERKDAISGCRLLDTFVYLDIPKGDD